MKVLKVFLFSFLNLGSLFAQVGGDNTYEFLNLTTSARISALGNVLVNSYDNDVNLAQQIPSLNHAGMNHQLALNFTNYYAGIKFGSLIYGIPSSRFENISVGMKYLNYGDFTRADEFGNVIYRYTLADLQPEYENKSNGFLKIRKPNQAIIIRGQNNNLLEFQKQEHRIKPAPFTTNSANLKKKTQVMSVTAETKLASKSNVA